MPLSDLIGRSRPPANAPCSLGTLGHEADAIACADQGEQTQPAPETISSGPERYGGLPFSTARLPTRGRNIAPEMCCYRRR